MATTALGAESEIPERHREFAIEIAKLCKRFGLMSCSGRFQPGVFDGWRASIDFSWNSGRHGDTAEEIAISSTVLLTAKVPAAAVSPVTDTEAP